MKQKRKLGRKLLSFLLTLAMVIGLVPGMGMTALAWDGDPYASLLNTTTVVTFDNKEWYLIENNSTAVDAGTVTLLTKECVAASQYNSSGSYVQYPSSTVKTAVDNWYNSNITDDAKGAVSSGGMFLLTIGQANVIHNANPEVLKCSMASGAEKDRWWLCSRGGYGDEAANVYGDTGYVYGDGNSVTKLYGVRPALQLDLSKVVFDSTNKTFSPSVSYPLWVGGVQVTSANKDDVFADTEKAGQVSFAPATDTTPATLTLNGFTFSGSSEGIKYGGSDQLNIVLTGENSITSTDNKDGIRSTGNLNFSGAGSLSVNASFIGAIYARNITMDSGTVTIEGEGVISGIRSWANNGYIVVNGGTLNAKGNCGIMADNDGSVTINGGTITASGSNNAIIGTVKNAIAGTGWTDTDGTQGKAAIPVSTDGQSLESYKKVQFPAAAKAAQTITAADVIATYGDTGKKVEATTDGNGAISYAVKDGSDDYIDVDSNTGALTIRKVGTATVIVTAAETATYAQATKEVTVTINKANAVVATVTANNRTFDGTEKPLVTVTGEAVGGEMQYAFGTKEAATEEYTTSIPTGTNAGTYYVWYKALGDATHSDSNPAVVTITISEETPTEPETDDGKTETEQKGSAHDNEKTSIDNDLTEIREIVSEEAQVDDSDTVRLILNTNSVDENADENKKAVDSIKSKIEADNLNIGSFLDITLSFIVEDANGTKKSSGQLAELNGRSLSVRFPIPSKLQASGRLFRIFRFHGGKAEEVGSGRGDAVVLSLDKFSLYAIAYEDGAAPEETEESEKKVVKPHTHTYAWDKVEATESQDGELRYQCTECYDILVRVPLSAYYVFNANTVDKINKAKQGETVKITTDRWISFHKMVFDALAARPDVSLEISFLDGEYKGNRVSFTIPAGADNSDLFTENNFAGFMYLGNKYGLTAEEN